MTRNGSCLTAMRAKGVSSSTEPNWVIRVLDASLDDIRSIGSRTRKRSPNVRNRLSKKQRGRCIYCSNKLDPHGRSFAIDHITPLSAGGGNEEDNLQALCRKCNEWKSDHTDKEFRQRISEGRRKLGKTSQRLSRQLLDEIMRATDRHENVKQRRTNRLRWRLIAVLWLVWIFLGGAAGIVLQWDNLPLSVGPLWGVLCGLYVAFGLALLWRARRRGFLKFGGK